MLVEISPSPKWLNESKSLFFLITTYSYFLSAGEQKQLENF